MEHLLTRNWQHLLRLPISNESHCQIIKRRHSDIYDACQLKKQNQNLVLLANPVLYKQQSVNVYF